jgi:hypothetical protein
MLIKIEHELSVDKVRAGIRAHVDRHKNLYYVGSLAVVAGITYAITRSTIAQRVMGEGLNAQRALTNTASFSFAKNATLNNVSFIVSNRQGPPSWVIKCVETGEEFLSQRSTAIAKGLRQSDLSQHLNGLQENVNGLHFERLCLAI